MRLETDYLERYVIKKNEEVNSSYAWNSSKYVVKSPKKMKYIQNSDRNIKDFIFSGGNSNSNNKGLKEEQSDSGDIR